MKFAFVNPDWNFRGSIYFGCQEAHYPLELLFAFDEVEAAGHDAFLIDAHLERLGIPEVKRQLSAIKPDFLVIPTAPSYLFWRCPPPELRIPQLWFRELNCSATKVAIGPHGSATPRPTLHKLNCDVVLRGEPDQVLPRLATQQWSQLEGCCWRSPEGEYISDGSAVTDIRQLRALEFHNYPVENHRHRHHVFDGEGLGAELEFARGCPWACSFCNKTLFRNKYRERDVEVIITEVDRLIDRGVTYIYFIDETFGVGKHVRRLLEELSMRRVTVGLQTRIDLWNEDSLDMLGRAHCISLECGVESITEQGRDELNKGCLLSTERMSDLLIHARTQIPWVEGNLILTEHDDRADVRKWQERLEARGVWVSEAVPMFPFPGTPDYQQKFGPPDDYAWERAHRYYLETFADKGYSDIQETRPASLEDLECTF